MLHERDIHKEDQYRGDVEQVMRWQTTYSAEKSILTSDLLVV